MNQNDSHVVFSDVDELIAELETQFGAEKLLPPVRMETNTHAGCTVVPSCACLS